MDILKETMTMIAKAGEAKAIALDAIKIAREGKYEEAREQIAFASKLAVEGNKSHAALLFNEAQTEEYNVSIFLVHAADHLSSSSTIITLVEEMIKNMEVINNV